MLPRIIPISTICTMETTRQKYFDVRYSQVYFHLHNVQKKQTCVNIPIGPPLPRQFQIFQIRMTSESPSCEWALHTKPYYDCATVDFIFRCQTNQKDEMLQETWLVVNSRKCAPPYLFLTFIEKGDIMPGRSRLELRITG